MASTVSRLACVVLPIVLLAGAVTPAYAADDNKEAVALFEEGRKLMGKGDYAAAIERFEKILAKTRSVGALLNLAECHQKLGHTATAFATFKQAAALASETNDDERSTTAEQHARALEGQLLRLTIKAEAAAGFEITVDGVVLPPQAYGVARPVDPGPHRVEAHAAGAKTWTQTVDVNQSQVVVTVPPLTPNKEEPAKPEATPTPTEPPPSSDGGGNGQKILAVVVGGIGVVGVAVGIVGGLEAKSNQEDARSHCASYPDHCSFDDSARGPNDSAQSWATISTIGFIVGGAGLVGGVALWLTAPSSKSSASVRITPGIASMALGGTF